MKKKPSIIKIIYLFLSAFLLFLIWKQLKLTWQEYQLYHYDKNIKKGVESLIEKNRELQEKLLKSQQAAYLEIQAREKLLLGLKGEIIYKIKKNLFRPPALKETKFID